VWNHATVRFENVWLRYDRRAAWVLQSVDVALDRGQVAIVLGKNGVGKSTLLAAAAGLLRPDRGRIVDRPQRVGFVPERFPANQPFTVSAYLVGMARVHGLTREAAMEQVDLWSERLFLTRYLDVHLSELSKGTAQKVGLIQAMIPRPDLLVLDEPWEGLDAQTRDLIPDIVGEVLAVGGSVLVSDHLGEVARLPGARRWHIEGNRVHHQQSTDDDQARFVIEIGVAAPDVPRAVDQLRGLGHEVLRVRAPRVHEALAAAFESPLALPARSTPPSEIPWHDTPGRDARGGQVTRHGSRSDLDEGPTSLFGWEFRR
jgi:ABC-2 type transport system ATP-binding protein